MNRKLLAAVILVFAAAAGNAQTATHQAIASQFNNWRVYGSQNLAASANPQVAFTPCALTAGQYSFNAISASTPIKIYDPGNPAVDEVVTPTSIVVNSNGCTATITPSNAHTTPWYIGSGSFGLQEAINATALSGQLNPVILDTAWHQAGGGLATIYAAAGNATTTVLDVTISPSASFHWNGTHYISNYTVNTGTITLAAGAAAGSSPTVSNTTNSTSNLMTANVATGTATTTGTLFTETTSTTFTANMNCVVQSVGANPFPVPITLSSTGTVLTATVASAPPVSTAYIFNISCN